MRYLLILVLLCTLPAYAYKTNVSTFITRGDNTCSVLENGQETALHAVMAAQKEVFIAGYDAKRFESVLKSLSEQGRSVYWLTPKNLKKYKTIPFILVDGREVVIGGLDPALDYSFRDCTGVNPFAQTVFNLKRMAGW